MHLSSQKDSQSQITKPSNTCVWGFNYSKKNEGFQSQKSTGFIYKFDIGFCNSDALDSGVLTVVGSYK